MKTIFQTLLLLLSFSIAFAQAPAIQWQHTYGGPSFDQAHAIDFTTDGGYILAGYTTGGGGQVTNFDFSYDYWVVKINSKGKLQWESAYGGSNIDIANDIHQTRDGGYIVAGSSESSDGDLVGAGGHGDSDFWILKLDANGNKQWSKEYGGINDDVAHSIQQTSDNGYIVAGESLSANIQGQHGADDYLVIKIDSVGNIEWQNAYGGSGTDFATAVIQLSDGTYMVGGTAGSADGQVTGNHGGNDYWILHLDAQGSLLSQKTYGGSGFDNVYAISDAGNGQFYVAGSSMSNNGDVTGNHGNADYWIIKIDNNGNLVWQKDLGGNDLDQPSSVVTTSDGGCFITGMTRSINGDVTGNHGNYDFWLVKLKKNGNLQWQETLGGSQTDEGFGGRQVSNGSYIVAGYAGSNDDEVTNNHGGMGDFWVVKLKNSSQPGIEVNKEITATPANESVLSVFQNPGSNSFVLSLNNLTSSQSATVQVMNTLGQTVFSKVISIQNGNVNTEIQLNNQVTAGLYYVAVFVDNKRYSTAFLIE